MIFVPMNPLHSFDGPADGDQFDYLLQDNVSDMEFLWSLARQVSSDALVEVAEAFVAPLQVPSNVGGQ